MPGLSSKQIHHSLTRSWGLGLPYHDPLQRWQHVPSLAWAPSLPECTGLSLCEEGAATHHPKLLPWATHFVMPKHRPCGVSGVTSKHRAPSYY